MTLCLGLLCDPLTVAVRQHGPDVWQTLFGGAGKLGEARLRAGRLRIGVSLIGSIEETQEMLCFLGSFAANTCVRP